MSGGEGLAAWLRRRIEERLYLARHAIELGNAAEWTEMSSGVLLTSPPGAPGTWDGVWVTGDSSLTRLMEANDPRDTIARCEAELGILGEHGPCELAPGVLYCSACGDVSQVPFPCRTVRLLGTGYKHRDGYREEWAP